MTQLDPFTLFMAFPHSLMYEFDEIEKNYTQTMEDVQNWDKTLKIVLASSGQKLPFLHVPPYGSFFKEAENIIKDWNMRGTNITRKTIHPNEITITLDRQEKYSFKKLPHYREFSTVPNSPSYHGPDSPPSDRRDYSLQPYRPLKKRKHGD